jgi:hypothetical protein
MRNKCFDTFSGAKYGFYDNNLGLKIRVSVVQIRLRAPFLLLVNQLPLIGAKRWNPTLIAS